ncbi:MAG TPA: hypothetical protein VGM39_13405 [Kofleriaceae bacterium]|jgi:hypothetical protein
MRVKAVAIACVLVACACPKKATEPTAAGSGSAAAVVPASGDACAAIKSKVEQLYKADAQATEPNRVADATADNVQMVMTDCAANPAKVASCVQAASTVKDIEMKCLARVDEAGNPLP